MNFYPLLLHVDSNSTGLVFNYYYSYLTKQIGSSKKRNFLVFYLIRNIFFLANNIFITFTFKENLTRELFPLTISVVLKTFIEEIFLSNCPSTIECDDLILIQSKVLKFNFDSTRFRSFNGNEIVVTYSLIGVNDFGLNIQNIQIWQQLPHLNHLTLVQLKDDIRQWNEHYQPSPIIPKYYFI